ncbi:2Fe-2S iron-sulfur cluster binding domain-containing protein [Paraburkholderia sp. 5N]|uniref:2Fe-2S iron-sulfur cluster binding domain-containing protein n=1 Tax=Paraburkholderia elongata TaxID=2675747 RepID=A0A972SIH7_9BURK|nr:2Fe-2S iron-sulfur cluster binding domain-containing protein [Paraburkholderia elongata]
MRRIFVEAADIRSIELVGANGRSLAPFEAGAHVDVHLGELIRQYSLINATDVDGSYRIAIKLEPNSRGGSRLMHALAEGETLKIGLPRNNFALDLDAAHSVLLAGGIGITPLLGMAYQLLARGNSFSFDYFARSSDRVAFAEEIRSTAFAPRTQIHLGLIGDEVQRALATRLDAVSPNAHVYTCGPAPFMRAVREAVTAKPGLVLHLEYFAAEPPAQDLKAGAFHVRLAKSGTTIPVNASQTIVESLRTAGIEIETSCEQGICGTCLTAVLAGRPDHRDMMLTEEEQKAGDCMLICVSRSLDAELVLDL